MRSNEVRAHFPDWTFLMAVNDYVVLHAGRDSCHWTEIHPDRCPDMPQRSQHDIDTYCQLSHNLIEVSLARSVAISSM